MIPPLPVEGRNIHSRVFMVVSYHYCAHRKERRVYDKQRQQQYQGPPGGFARGVALRAHGVSCEGKGIHATSRRTEPAAARAPMGESGQAVRLRWTQRQGDVGRALRTKEPAHRLSLYVPTRG